MKYSPNTNATTIKNITSLIFIFVIFGHSSIKAQWTQLNSGTSNTLNHVVFTDAMTGYAGGVAAVTQGTLFKTTDGGTSWLPQNLNTVHDVTSISFGASNTGYVCTFDGSLHKTTDGGSNWTNIKTFICGEPVDHFSGPNTGIVTGGFYFYRTTDGGSSLDSSYVASFPNTTDMHFPTPLIGYTCTYFGKLAKTADAGISWNMIAQPTSQPTWRIHFTDASTCCLASSQSLLKTTDGGLNWTAMSNGGSAVGFLTPSRGYSGSAPIFETTDSGAT